MQKISLAVLPPTVFVLVFLALSGWGLLDISRLGWCAGGLLSCDQARDALEHAGACALISAAIALLAVVMTHGRQLQSAKFSIFLGLICSALLVMAYPASQSLRSAVAAQYFPYNTAIRFGPLGFYGVWTVVNGVAFTLIFAGAGLVRRQREQS